MKPAFIVAILFSAILPVLHLVYDYPWRGWYLATTILYTILLWGCGFVTGYTWFEWRKEADQPPPAEVDPFVIEPVIKKGIVVVSGTIQIICPECPYGEGQSDLSYYGAINESFIQTCENCGTVYNSMKVKA